MRALALLLLLMLLPARTLATPPQAQDPIHHCVDAHGNPVFTDQPCTALQATPVQAPAPARSASVATGLPVPLVRCAATPAGLRQRVIDAFAARDPNQLAGLMLWHGYGSRAAIGDIRALGRLVRQPLLDIHLGSDDGGDDAEAAQAGATMPSTASTLSTDVLRVRTGSADGSQSARFAIVQRAGCLWLRYAD